MQFDALTGEKLDDKERSQTEIIRGIHARISEINEQMRYLADCGVFTRISFHNTPHSLVPHLTDLRAKFWTTRSEVHLADS